MKSSVISAILGAAMLTAAHPGQSRAELQQEVEERSTYLNSHKRSLAHCADKLKARGNDIAMHNRREAMVENLRKKRSISQGKPRLYFTYRLYEITHDLYREALPPRP